MSADDCFAGNQHVFAHRRALFNLTSSFFIETNDSDNISFNFSDKISPTEKAFGHFMKSNFTHSYALYTYAEMEVLNRWKLLWEQKRNFNAFMLIVNEQQRECQLRFKIIV